MANHPEEESSGRESKKAPKAHAGGFTLDLSAGRPPSRRKRKQPAAVVQKTINLSSKPAKAPEPPAAPAPAVPAHWTEKRTAVGSGNTLADLLDPATLARLRGGGD